MNRFIDSVLKSIERQEKAGASPAEIRRTNVEENIQYKYRKASEKDQERNSELGNNDSLCIDRGCSYDRNDLRGGDSGTNEVSQDGCF